MGISRIQWVRPAGERVKPGDQLCLLDDTVARARLSAQGVRVEQARREVNQAVLQREAAELAVEECRALDEMETLRFREEVRLARATRELARLRLSEARSARPVVAATVRKAENALSQATARLTEAEGEAKALEAAGPSEALREALAEVERLGSQEKAARSGLDEALETAARLQSQVDARAILAPAAGTLHYVRERPPGDERGYSRIEVGAFARRGQALFRIIPERATERR
jgi:multidrug resistance efflux pump